MSHLPSPRHKSAPPPRRLLAMGGAAVITGLTLAGAMGVGPGAAAGNANKDRHAATAVADQAADDTADESTGGTGSGSESDGWLTVDKSKPDNAGSGDADASADDPAVPAGSGSGERIVFDMGDQRVWLVGDDGKVERTYLVSGSKHDNLDAGEYTVSSMSRHAVSFNHNETMNYMVRFAQGDHAPIGFHDIPAFDDGTLAQTRAELGSPQSAGCIRQWRPDALALWKFSSVGTPVVVLA